MKTGTRSDTTGTTTPSTQTQVAFTQTSKEGLEELGTSNIIYNEMNGFVVAILPSSVEKDVRSVGFIAHMDTADFNAVNVSPQIVGSYDEESAVPLDKKGKFTLSAKDFPNLKNYRGKTLITTGGTTLLGADDKSNIVEIMTAMEHLINHPETKHDTIRMAFGPDEEVGVGADKFDAAQFNVSFVYTMDSGPVGELQFETFSAAQTEVTVQEENVHPGTAKGTMISALQLGIDFHNALPANEVPEKTAGEESFYHLTAFARMSEEATMIYIIRDHNCEIFETRKAKIKEIQQALNAPLNEERIKVDLFGQYYSMQEVVEKDISIIEVAKQAMEELSTQPAIEPIRGETDGSKISYLGIPTSDIFADGENMHGHFEFVSSQAMERATNVIIKVAELSAE